MFTDDTVFVAIESIDIELARFGDFGVFFKDLFHTLLVFSLCFWLGSEVGTVEVFGDATTVECDTLISVLDSGLLDRTSVSQCAQIQIIIKCFDTNRCKQYNT